MTHCIISDHNAVKLKIDMQKNSSKYENFWWFNSSLPNDEYIKEEIKQ